MRRFVTPGWLLRHAALVVLVAGFLAMGWWQLDRARGGNALSFGYAVEWPVFALFVIFLWYREVRAELRGGYERPVAQPDVPDDLRISVPIRPSVASDDDGETDAYNEYLAWLAEHPEAKPTAYQAGRGPA